MTALPLSDYPSALSKPLAVLQSVFGYDRFRGPQAEIVTHVVAGGDALVLMPTGGGKSLCYQIPALVRDGCGIVPVAPVACVGSAPTSFPVARS